MLFYIILVWFVGCGQEWGLENTAVFLLFTSHQSNQKRLVSQAIQLSVSSKHGFSLCLVQRCPNTGTFSLIASLGNSDMVHHPFKIYFLHILHIFPLSKHLILFCMTQIIFPGENFLAEKRQLCFLLNFIGWMSNVTLVHSSLWHAFIYFIYISCFLTVSERALGGLYVCLCVGWPLTEQMVIAQGISHRHTQTHIGAVCLCVCVYS